MDDAEKIEKTEDPETKEEHKHHHAQKDEPAETEAGDQAGSEPAGDMPKSSLKHKSGNFLEWFKSNKKISVPASAAVFLLVFFAIPFTRYTALGLFLKQDFSVVVVDSQSGKPVSAAEVSLRGKTASTDGEGKAELRVPVGRGELTVTKAYYKTVTQAVTVTLGKPDELKLKLEATGRLVPVSVTNNITRQPVANAVLSAGQSEAKTDDKGQATLVVPTNVKELEGTLSGDGFNRTDITIKVTTEEDDANKFGLTPSGKIYFLSNKSGKIDVVKSDLDGKNRETILRGTGKEKKDETSLLATRDWKYLALQSRRDGGDYDKLFLINTADGKTTVMDEGEATFSLIGWEDHNFAYRVDRVKVDGWKPKKYALKSFNAESKKLTTLDQTSAEGNSNNSANEFYAFTTILDGKLIFIKGWNTSYNRYKGKNFTLNSVPVGGGDKKTLKSLPMKGRYAYTSQKFSGYDQFYFYFYDGDQYNYYRFDDGKVTDLKNFDNDDYGEIDYGVAYLQSPSKKLSFWYESRDGKRVFFAADPEAKDPKQIMELEENYQIYGWYTDDYILLSKKGSELFIAPSTGVEKEDQLLKVTDYYRPDYSYYGYGGGYGGL